MASKMAKEKKGAFRKSAKAVKQDRAEKDIPPQFGPPSPLLGRGTCSCEVHALPSSSEEEKRPPRLKPCKRPRELVNLDSDSGDSVMASDAEQDGRLLKTELPKPSPRSPGTRKFMVVSSEDESEGENRKEQTEVSIGALETVVYRRSARLLNLLPKAEETDHQRAINRKLNVSNRKSRRKECDIKQEVENRAEGDEDIKLGDEGSELGQISVEGRAMGSSKGGGKRLCKAVATSKQQTCAAVIHVQAATQETSDPAKRVKETLRLFNSYYLRFVQDEEARCQKEATKAPSKKNAKSTKKDKDNDKDERRKSRRPDLKAIQQMKLENKFIHKEKILGHVAGINVGDQFFSRCELMAIGLHGHWLAGIDYVGNSYKRILAKCTLPLASSIVLSGLYEDDVDNSEDVVYTGQGGNDLLGNKRQIADQIMERGNLALKNSMEQDMPVRLIRGHKTKKSYTGKVYTYDGLYKVKEFWAEKGISGFTVFKFRLHRIEGQLVLTTDQVHFCNAQVPSSPAELRGIVYPDLSNGLERIPIPASNVVDNPAVAPDCFKYIIKNEVQKEVPKPIGAKGCDCVGGCIDVMKCLCAALNGKKFPYVSKNGGRLVEPMDVVYECGPECGCGPSCINRVSQRGLFYRLEVFRTANKGWGVRSWDTIPAGAPVCEYTGLLMKTDDADTINENDYIFELDCLQTMKSIGARQRRLLSKATDPNSAHEDADRNVAEQPEYCINAGSSGNVSRFINHSCEPNLFVQCVLNTHHDLSQPRVMLFASDNILPLQELTYDYGYELDSVVIDGKVKRLPCYCGAHGCRKRLY